MRIEYDRGFCELCAAEKECEAKSFEPNDLISSAKNDEPECPYYQQIMSLQIRSLDNRLASRTKGDTSVLLELKKNLLKTKEKLKQRKIDGDTYKPFTEEEIMEVVNIDHSPIHQWRGTEFINTYVNNCGLSREFWLPLHKAIALRGLYPKEMLEEEKEDYENNLENITQEARLVTPDNIQREIIFTLVLENLENLWVLDSASQNQL